MVRTPPSPSCSGREGEVILANWHFSVGFGLPVGFRRSSRIFVLFCFRLYDLDSDHIMWRSAGGGCRGFVLFFREALWEGFTFVGGVVFLFRLCLLVLFFPFFFPLFFHLILFSLSLSSSSLFPVFYLLLISFRFLQCCALLFCRVRGVLCVCMSLSVHPFCIFLNKKNIYPS